MTCNDQHPGQWSGSSHDTTTTPTRLQQTHKLLADLSGELLRIASDDPRLLLPADTEPILRSIIDYAGRYDGPMTEQALLEWATSIILPQRTFYAIKRETERSVYAAIWRTLGHSSEPSKWDDYPELVQEIAAEIWLWAFEHIQELSQPGTAALTTRLYARAKITTRAWLKRQYTRRNAVIRQVYGLGTVKASQDMAARLDTAERLRTQEREETEEIHLDMEATGIALNL